MKLSRRRLLHAAAGGAVVPAIAPLASASDYPTRPVHLIAAETEKWSKVIEFAGIKPE